MNSYYNSVPLNEDRFVPTVDQQNNPYSNQQLEQTDTSINVKLQDLEMWNKFSGLKTEMIVTKAGRRMFPGYRIKLEGLNPSAQYCVLMDVVSVDQHRYKFQQGEWVVAGRGEPQVPQRFYLHPNSPCNGAKWMKDIVTFHKVKLTNSCGNSANGKFFVHSMHRYQTRIHVVRTDDVSSLHLQPMSSFEFPQTKFITVTAYQNNQITQLKIDNNPFARGFRKGGKKNLNQEKVFNNAQKISSKRNCDEEFTVKSKMMRQQLSPDSHLTYGYAYNSPPQGFDYYSPPVLHTSNYYQTHPTYQYTSPQDFQYASTETYQPLQQANHYPCQTNEPTYFYPFGYDLSSPQHVAYTPALNGPVVQPSYCSNTVAFRSPLPSADDGYYSTTTGNAGEDSHDEFSELLPPQYSTLTIF